MRFLHYMHDDDSVRTFSWRHAVTYADGLRHCHCWVDEIIKLHAVRCGQWMEQKIGHEHNWDKDLHITYNQPCYVFEDQYSHLHFYYLCDNYSKFLYKLVSFWNEAKPFDLTTMTPSDGLPRKRNHWRMQPIVSKVRQTQTTSRSKHWEPHFFKKVWQLIGIPEDSSQMDILGPS